MLIVDAQNNRRIETKTSLHKTQNKNPHYTEHRTMGPADSDKPVACISCRMRRKKCDRALPVCGRCLKLNIPKEWCLYHDSVGLYDKDSKATLETEQTRNRELRREMEQYEELFQVLRESNEHKDEGLFMAGLSTNDPSSFVSLPGIEGYLGSLSLPATAFYTGKSQKQPGVDLDIVANARQKYHERKRQENPQHQGITVDDFPALATFENMCTANLVGIPVLNGLELLRSLLRELEGLLPTQQEYALYFKIFEDKNAARVNLGSGWPSVCPPGLVQQMKDVIHYGFDGAPTIQAQLPAEGHKLVTLALTLNVIAMGHFVCSKIPSLHCSNPNLHYTTYERYIRAVLKAEHLDHAVSINPDPLYAPLFTMAHFLLHVLSSYSSSSNFTIDQPNPQARVHHTKMLIALAMAQHLHLDLSPHYPDLPTEYHNLYRELWNCIVALDTIDCLELGYLSSIQLKDFVAANVSSTPVAVPLRTIHQLINNTSFVDGAITASKMLDMTQIHIKQVKADLNSLKESLDTDLSAFRSLTPQNLERDPSLITKYYKAVERIHLRILSAGVLQSLYCLCLHCVQSMGETCASSTRARAFRVSSLKYALATVDIFKGLYQQASLVGDDEGNLVGQIHMLSVLQWKGIAESSTVRAVIWWGLCSRDYADLRDDEVVTFLKFHNTDWKMHESVMGVLSRRKEYQGLPGLNDFMDLEIDDDHERLLNKLGMISEANYLIYIMESRLMEFRTFFSPEFMDLDFLSLGRALLLSYPGCSLGIRYFFPDEVKDYLRSSKPGTASSSSSSSTDADTNVFSNALNDPDHSTDFAGTFRDLFEKVINTKTDGREDRY